MAEGKVSVQEPLPVFHAVEADSARHAGEEDEKLVAHEDRVPDAALVDHSVHLAIIHQHTPGETDLQNTPGHDDGVDIRASLLGDAHQAPGHEVRAKAVCD